MDKLEIALNVSELGNEALVKKLKDALTANTPPATGKAAPALAPPFVALQTTLGQIASTDTDIAATLARLNGLRQTRLGLIRTACDHYAAGGQVVLAAAQGDVAYIRGHNYDVVSSATHTSVLPQITEPHAADGDAEHSVDLNWKALRIQGVLYVIEATTDPAGKTGFQQVDVCTASKYTALNLTPGTYWFRIAARKGKVQGPWSLLVRVTV